MAGITFESIFYGIVLQNSAAGAVFILFILAFRFVTRYWSKGYVRILWILLLACLLAPPLFHSSFYTVRNWGMERQADAGAESSYAGMPAAGVKTTSNPRKNLLESQSAQNRRHVGDKQTWKSENDSSYTGSYTQRGSIRAADKIKAWAAVIWFSGACMLALLYLYQYSRLRKKMSDAVFVPWNECRHMQQAEALKRVPGTAFSSSRGYWVSGQTDVPFVMPGFKPRIYMPDGIADAQKADILAHELRHIKNFDPLVKCLASAALAVYWFHPLVWLAVSLMGKDLEMYCDECVLHGKSIQERKAYSGTLLEYAAHSSGLSITMHFGESNTGQRIRHILRVKKPRMIVSLLLSASIGISGVWFLSSGNVEAEKQTAQAGSSMQETTQAGSSMQDTNRSNKYNADINNLESSGLGGNSIDKDNSKEDDPFKFAAEIIRLVREEKKNELARLIYFPIRAEIDGEEIYVQNRIEFVENYDKIAGDEWKNGILDADISQMISNSMGYGMGSGRIWFSEMAGLEGYWIYAINNAEKPNNLDDSIEAEDGERSMRNEWQQLAAEHGMTAKEAKKWYVRFSQDGLETGSMHITGCAYKDFDENGEKDLFIAASVLPDEIYSDSMPFTMCVYGYLNGELSYQSGSSGFSKDGFIQCEAEDVSENGIGCRIRYTVDTDNLIEQPHLVDFDTRGNFIREQLPGEFEKFIHMLTEIPHEEYENAAGFEQFLAQARNASGSSAADGQIVSLYENTAEDIYVYGYFLSSYADRGTIIRYKDTYSYFDMSICREYLYEKPSIYFTDIDKDSNAELVCIYSAGHGTGIYTGGLTVFDLQQDHTVSGYELKAADQLQQVGKFIHFDREHGKVQIRKDGRIKKEIDLAASSEYIDNKDTVEVNYSNWYYYEMEDGRIKLKVDILGQIGFLWYMDGVEDSLTEFDVLFENKKFIIDYI